MEIMSFQQSLSPPFLINAQNCLKACNNKGGYCGGFCGNDGYCCRKGYGDCLESYEAVSTETHHSCVKGIVPDPKHKEEQMKGYKECRIDVLAGTHNIVKDMIFGELDQLPDEYSFTFDIQPIINTTRDTEYKVVLFSKDAQWLGGKFSIFGKSGTYYVDFCGSMSGDYGGCTGYKTTHLVGEWIHVHVHQKKNKFDVSTLEVFINGILQERVTNIIPQSRIPHMKTVLVVLPRTPNAGYIRDVHFVACGSKFNQTTNVY